MNPAVSTLPDTVAAGRWELPAARVLHFISSNFVGGPEKQILAHAQIARAAGCDVIIGSFPGTEILERAASLKVPTLEAFDAGFFFPASALALARAMKSAGIALIVTYGYKADLVGGLAARWSGARQLAFVRGWTGENWKVRRYEALDRFLIRSMRHVACVSSQQAAEIGRRRGNDARPLVIPNAALQVGNQQDPTTQRERARKALALPAEGFLVGAVGRLSPEKGHRFLIDSLPLLEDITPLKLIVLGDGPERTALERRVGELGLGARVFFAGFQKDIQAWLPALDILVNPSLTEGMPNAVLEAMAVGVPVVATQVGGLPEMIEHNESGLLLPAGDPQAIAAAVRELYQARDKRKQLAEGARARARQFSPEVQCQQLFAAYREALGA